MHHTLFMNIPLKQTISAIFIRAICDPKFLIFCMSMEQLEFIFGTYVLYLLIFFVVSSLVSLRFIFLKMPVYLKILLSLYFRKIHLFQHIPFFKKPTYLDCFLWLTMYFKTLVWSYLVLKMSVYSLEYKSQREERRGIRIINYWV